MPGGRRRRSRSRDRPAAVAVAHRRRGGGERRARVQRGPRRAGRAGREGEPGAVARIARRRGEAVGLGIERVRAVAADGHEVADVAVRARVVDRSQDRRARVDHPDDLPHLAAEGGRDVHRHRAQDVEREMGDDELVRVAQRHDDAVAVADAAAGERGGGAQHARVELVARDGAGAVGDGGGKGELAHQMLTAANSRMRGNSSSPYRTTVSWSRPSSWTGARTKCVTPASANACSPSRTCSVSP
jgi:hypothetical protein